MMTLGLTVAVLLAQTFEAAPARAMTSEERAVTASERAAVAAEKAATAAQRIADAVAGPLPVDAAGVVQKPDGPWAGNVGLGLAYLTGNAEQLTITGSAAASRKWGDWGFGIKLNGAYGLSNPAANIDGTTAAITARRAMGTIRGDRSFNGSFASVFVLAGLETDHMKNIEARGYGELGTGLTFFNVKQADLEKLFIRLDIAMRAGYESRFRYFPTPARVTDPRIAILAPRIALAFRWAFSKDVRISEDLEFIPFLLAPTSGRLLINNTTKLNARLSEALSLATSLLLNFDSQPPGNGPVPAASDRRTTDVALTVGLEAAF